MKISVVVPLYQDPKFFADIATKILQNTYPQKEVIAAVDGDLTPEILEALKPFEGKVQVFHPNTHLGKAKLLNEAVSALKTDILLFLDNDILLPDDSTFLHTLKEKMTRYDLVEMAKEVVKESIYSAMISYEYIGFAMTHFIFSQLSNRLPSVIGSAFAVRKDLFDRLGGFKAVVHEDLDFGARAFRLDAKYHFSIELKVHTSMPNTAKDWFKQRRRWVLINLLWFKENILYILSRMVTHPRLFPTFLLLISPAILSWLVFFLFNQTQLTYLFSALLLVTQYHQYVWGLFFWYAHYTMLAKGIISALASFLLSAFLFFSFSRFLKFKFNFWEYVAYYFVYMPIIVVFHVGIFLELLFEKRVRVDWKVSEG
ncbi:MAG: glycosyltransferase family 2 protein [Spirochaetes bacterium]|nr:glycosyltransferase family 2 protein [Spirochaetota bacterium]